MKELKKETIYIIIWTFIYAFILSFFVFLIGKANMQEVMYIINIVVRYESSLIFIFGLASYLVILSLLFISKAIFKNNVVSNLVVTIIVTVIALISYYKCNILGTPFLPTDVLLIGNANQIAKFGLTFPPIHIICSVVILAVILIIQFIIEKRCKISYKVISWKKELLYRIPLLLIGIITIYNVCLGPTSYIKNKLKPEMMVLYTFSDGVLVFFSYLDDFWNNVPEGYSEEKVQEIKNEYIDKIKLKENQKEDEKVNVILIMNESFSDPTQIKDVTYSIDPLEDIRNLANKDINCKIGEVITPVLGGGTSVPEFEVLTGLSSHYFEKQIYPFTRYITSEMSSIVREYSKNGYETLGLHTHIKSFYNREAVYKLLGFEETIFEQDIENPERIGEYVSDQEFKKQIINKLENSRGTKKFIFGVTMQNHMPYEDKEYDTYNVNITSNKYNNQQINSLNNYAQGVYDGNKIYIELVEYLKTYEEPTILVMFGDHLPALEDYMFYKESGFDDLQMYKTPYIIWSNYGEDLSGFPEDITTSSLGLAIYKMSGNTLPWYLTLYEEIYENYYVFNNQFVIDKEGNPVSKEELDRNKLVQKGEILQYKILNVRNEVF